MPMLRIKVGNMPPFCAHQFAGLKPQAAVRSDKERGVKSRMWPEGSNCFNRFCSERGQKPYVTD